MVGCSGKGEVRGVVGCGGKGEVRGVVGRVR